MIEISGHFGFVSLCFVSLAKQSAGECPECCDV